MRSHPTVAEKPTEINPHFTIKKAARLAMPQRPVGLDMKLSQPNNLSRPKFNFKMFFFFRGGLFPQPAIR